MTRCLYQDDPYLTEATASIREVTDEGGLILDQSIFYPAGGGQPGDSGTILWAGGKVPIATTLHMGGGRIVLVPAEPMGLPEPGDQITQRLDWERRHRHMRVHTALHLLTVVVPLPVTGGSIGAEKGRLDFDMPDAVPDRAAIEHALVELVDQDLPVTQSWITRADLDANPGLIKTMSVAPPAGQGRVRLIRIGTEAHQVDLQPCGGTHVARTGEIGGLRLGRIEKKGRQNRRINILID